MPFLVAAQLVWDSSELGNLQKKRKNMTVQINEKSLLKTYFVFPPPPLPPPPPSLSRVFQIYQGSKLRTVNGQSQD